MVRVIQSSPRHGGPEVGPLLARVLEGEPATVAARLTHDNAATVAALARRLNMLRPELEVHLWGAEAAARREELEAEPWVTRVGSDPRGGAATRPLPAGAIAALGRQSRRWGEPVTVEAAWDERLTVAEAASQCQALLSAGLEVWLGDHGITNHRGRLRHLLRRLPDGCGERLTLALPQRALDPELCRELSRVGVRELELELAGRPAPGLREALATLTLDGVGVRGEMAYGDPDQDLPGLAATLDGYLAAGLDDVTLECLRAPPGCRLREGACAAGLTVAPTPPYEVLAHRRMDAAEMANLTRTAATWNRVRHLVAGTGLLRILSGLRVPVLTVMEGFAEHLALRGRDPLVQGPGAALRQELVAYLRQRHGLDLALQEEATHHVRSPALTLRWQGGGGRILADEDTGRTAHVGSDALRLLDQFGVARAFREVSAAMLEEVQPGRRAALRRDLMRTMGKLSSLGFLVPASSSNGAGREELAFTCLDEFEYHTRMLADRTRSEAYRRAIQRAVRPGDHVVEVGTGTGILAVWAAMAGARVTAIERYPVIKIAAELAQANGVAHRIKLVRGRADLVNLDEPGDLLITELVGNRILNEGLLETTLDARSRLLRPGARLLPAALEIGARLGRSDRFDMVRGQLSALGQGYDVELGVVADWLDEQHRQGSLVWEMNEGEEDGFVPLSEHTPLIHIDLARMKEPSFRRQVDLTPVRDGEANAVMLSFGLHLCPDVSLSTRASSHGLHWSRPVHMLARPVRCRRDEPLRVKFSYDAHGEIRVAMTGE